MKHKSSRFKILLFFFNFWIQVKTQCKFSIIYVCLIFLYVIKMSDTKTTNQLRNRRERSFAFQKLFVIFFFLFNNIIIFVCVSPELLICINKCKCRWYIKKNNTSDFAFIIFVTENFSFYFPKKWFTFFVFVY